MFWCPRPGSWRRERKPGKRSARIVSCVRMGVLTPRSRCSPPCRFRKWRLVLHMFTHLRSQCRTPSKRMSLSRVSGFQSCTIHCCRTIVRESSTLGVLPNALHVLISSRHLRRLWKQRCSGSRFLDGRSSCLKFPHQRSLDGLFESSRI